MSFNTYASLAIVSAMQEELVAVLALMKGQQKQTIAGRDFWLGQLHGREVIVVLSRIGKVAAATTATILIERFGVQSLVFTGVAGGLHPSAQVGDVVVATEFLHHDMDASPLFPKFEVPLTGVSRFAADAALSRELASAVSRALPQARLHLGLMVSGDRFVSTTAESRAIQAVLPDALAVEMEGAAIAQVCLDYGVAFAAVRTISDRADDAAHGDFFAFIQTTASLYSAAIVATLLISQAKPS
jgi:adenosylhomocysteine nucleosidase